MNDLAQAGYIAGFSAAKRYDNTIGLNFFYYLSRRLQGEMTDLCHPHRRQQKTPQFTSIESMRLNHETETVLDEICDPHSMEDFGLIETQFDLDSFEHTLSGRDLELYRTMADDPRYLALVGQDFGISEARVSQLRHRLRDQIHDGDPL